MFDYSCYHNGNRIADARTVNIVGAVVIGTVVFCAAAVGYLVRSLKA